jgi:hypothetical protein
MSDRNLERPTTLEDGGASVSRSLQPSTEPPADNLSQLASDNGAFSHASLHVSGRTWL